MPAVGIDKVRDNGVVRFMRKEDEIGPDNLRFARIIIDHAQRVLVARAGFRYQASQPSLASSVSSTVRSQLASNAIGNLPSGSQSKCLS